MDRKSFINLTIQSGIGLSLLGLGACSSSKKQDKSKEEASITDLFFKFSLAQWSLNKPLFAKKMDNLDFAEKAKSFGMEGLEYVAGFFKDKAKDMAYLDEMNKRATDNGLKNLLIMIDGEGYLAATDKSVRTEGVENHYKWVDAAKYMGCHSIRVNLFGEGSPQEQAEASVDSLGQLSTYAAERNINILVENHGGLSSDAEWLVGVMKQVNMPNCGTLPDFGNFCIKRDGGKPWEGKCVETYDRYKGIALMMPFAKAVSAKSRVFDDLGNELETDYAKAMQLVKSAGYTGYIGIEYEGEEHPDIGIQKTKDLMIKVSQNLE